MNVKNHAFDIAAGFGLGVLGLLAVPIHPLLTLSLACGWIRVRYKLVTGIRIGRL